MSQEWIWQQPYSVKKANEKTGRYEHSTTDKIALSLCSFQNQWQLKQYCVFGFECHTWKQMDMFRNISEYRDQSRKHDL